jgi:diaminopimelate decarboxylase
MSGPVTGFYRSQGVLTADGVDLDGIARQVGTPTHVYSGALIDERFRQLDAAFASVPHRLHYAIKANATLDVVRRIRQLGAGADANSGGEIEVALRAGFQPRDIVFTGVGKTPAELERAVSLDVAAINAESLGELTRINAIAAQQRRHARVAIRINPDVDAGSHPHISTGSHGTKFGVSIAQARAMTARVVSLSHLRLVGLHVHVGSQVVRTEPLARAAEAVARLAGDLAHDGVTIEHLDLGGGLGIQYQDEQTTVSPAEYAEAVLPAIRRSGLMLVLEPGRWIVGPSGILLTRVVDLKERPGGGWFVIVDAGMTELIRPALYGAYHRVEPVGPVGSRRIEADVVGPVCETSDTLAGNRDLPEVEVGDLLAIRDTGAYGAIMASNYNRRPMAAEVMIDNGTFRTIRRRQTIDDMLQWDV